MEDYTYYRLIQFQAIPVFSYENLLILYRGEETRYEDVAISYENFIRKQKVLSQLLRQTSSFIHLPSIDHYISDFDGDQIILRDGLNPYY